MARIGTVGGSAYALPLLGELLDNNVSPAIKETWSLTAYQNLVLDLEGDRGTSREELLVRFGQPSEIFDQSGQHQQSIAYTYRGEEPFWSVTIGLSDKDGDGIYRAYRKDFNSLPFSAYPTASDENVVFKWTPDLVDNLPTNQTVTADEIVASYGQPTEVFLSGRQDYSYAGQYQLEFRYQKDNRNDSTINRVTLIFYRNGEDGAFVLSNKEAIWRTD